MKRIILILVCLCFCSIGNAQVSFGPEAGGLFSNYIQKLNGEVLATKARLGLHIGGIVDYKFSNALSLQSGVLYVMNGYKLDYFFSNNIINVNTIEVPLSLIYKTGHPGKDRFFVGAGPYYALNLGGTKKETGNGTSSTTTFTAGNDRDNDGIKKNDFGLGLNVGYELTTGLYFRVHYQLGFVNLLPAGDADNSGYNRNYGFSVGYLFTIKSKSNKKS